MASAFFKPSRIVAVALVAAAGLWIASGYLLPHAEEPKRADADRRPGRVPSPSSVAVETRRSGKARSVR